ncbi:hypothetical protein CDV55_108109 [Aspergillus turcosus]|uniref:Uncharacterized protein n=1 Tax=Aspergillus turcosus TaxID=1245748 RepID=A0A229YV65_9EURO|nr:hypothetical protein CDV55_108109 [Aspergillus turcosus]RLL95162.1 hypothetical protein CFD26_105244 [Aspergillus turcosus]
MSADIRISSCDDEWEKRTGGGGGDTEEPWWRTSRSRDFAYEVDRALATAGRRMLVASAEVRHQMTMPSASVGPSFRI